MSNSLCTHRLYSPRNSPGQNTRVGSHSLLQGIFPTQGSNPGLLHCGWILYQLSHQGRLRILEWVAYPFSRGSSRHRNGTGGVQHCRQTTTNSMAIPGAPDPQNHHKEGRKKRKGLYTRNRRSNVANWFCSLNVF